jgi:beta-glucosidase/6-phospho-beta-glucosidase/beta-galactosidase
MLKILSWRETYDIRIRLQVPWGFRKLLNWLSKTYGSIDIYVTENGFADYPDTGVNDTGRVDYYTSYINEMLKAVKVDGINVKSYSAWSLLDNFEWQVLFLKAFSTGSRPRFNAYDLFLYI